MNRINPLQHKYPHYTPYQYAGNKPVTFIDLDGLEEKKKEDDQPPVENTNYGKIIPTPFPTPVKTEWEQLSDKVETKFKNYLVNGLMELIKGKNEDINYSATRKYLMKNIFVHFRTDNTFDIAVSKKVFGIEKSGSNDTKEFIIGTVKYFGKEGIKQLGSRKVEKFVNKYAAKKVLGKTVLWAIKESTIIEVVIDVLDPTPLGDPDPNRSAIMMGQLKGNDLLLKLATGEEKAKEKVESAYDKTSPDFPSPLRFIEGKYKAKSLERFNNRINNLIESK